MATTELTEAIAQAEKKMDMTLDDIIKMSKKNASKGRKPARACRGFLNGRGPQGNAKLKQFMDSRSSIRQGVLAQRRSTFRANQFPVTAEVARKAAAFPIRNRVFSKKIPRISADQRQKTASEGSYSGKDNGAAKQRPKTLDARFANIKEQRKVISQQQMTFTAARQNGQRHGNRRQQQQGRGAGAASRGGGRRFSNFTR